MKKLIWLLVAVSVLVSGGAILSPFYSFYQIANSIAENDTKKLSYYVAFPELRKNLKDQLNQTIESKFAKKYVETESRFSDVTYKFAKRLSDRLVDTYVTPQGLANLMGVDADKARRSSDTEEESKPAGKGERPALKRTSEEKFRLLKNARFSFASTHTFIISIPAQNNKNIRLVLNRKRFSWKLTSIVFPINDNRFGSSDISMVR